MESISCILDERYTPQMETIYKVLISKYTDQREYLTVEHLQVLLIYYNYLLGHVTNVLYIHRYIRNNRLSKSTDV